MPKARFVAFLRANVALTNRLITSLRRRGEPNASSGHQLAAAIAAGFTQLGDTFRSLAVEASQLPTTDPTAFEKAFQPLQTKFSDLQRQNQASFQLARQFQSPQLTQAFATQRPGQQLSKLN